jgi:hypothetical protein
VTSGVIAILFVVGMVIGSLASVFFAKTHKAAKPYLDVTATLCATALGVFLAAYLANWDKEKEERSAVTTLLESYGMTDLQHNYRVIAYFVKWWTGIMNKNRANSEPRRKRCHQTF